MKNIILLPLILATFLGCKKRQNDYIPKFNYGDSSLVRFHVTKNHDTVTIIYCYEMIFPENGYSGGIPFMKDSTYSYYFKVNAPQKILLKGESDFRVDIMVLPHDTLDVYLEMDSTKKLSKPVIFKGNTALISDYLTNNPTNLRFIPEKDESVEKYNEKVDSIEDRMNRSLTEYNKRFKLPNWFVNYEKMDIKYSSAYKKTIQFCQRMDLYNQYVPRPTNLHEKLGVEISNIDAQYSNNYIHFLYSIRPMKYDSLLIQRKARVESHFFEYAFDNVNSVKGYLGKDILSYFVAAKLSIFIDRRLESMREPEYSNYMQRVDSLTNVLQKDITDSTIRDVFFKYMEKRKKEIKERRLLHAGEKAPDFMLKSIDGKTINLTQFKGKTVLLNFWATWCLPCINSIPDKNLIAQKYNKKDLVLMNICLDSNVETWRKIIEEQKLQGLNLICKGNWSKLLSESYNITTIPHYTLIDKDGKIRENRIEGMDKLKEFLECEMK